MFFGLLSSFTIYSINFSGSVLPASVINPDRNLDVTTGKLHVLVTHGAGFLGSHIALALLDAGHAVTLVDDPTSRITHLYKLLKGTGRRMKVQSADLADAQQLQALLAAANPAVDAVMHLADPAGEGRWCTKLRSGTSRRSMFRILNLILLGSGTVTHSAQQLISVSTCLCLWALQGCLSETPCNTWSTVQATYWLC